MRGGGSDGRTLAFFGDLFMRPWAANPRWVTAFDDFPLDSVVRKAELFRQAVDEDWTIVLSHEREHPIGRLVARPGPVPVRAELTPIRGQGAGLVLGTGFAEALGAAPLGAGGSIDSMRATAPASSTGPWTTCAMTPSVPTKNWVGIW